MKKLLVAVLALLPFLQILAQEQDSIKTWKLSGSTGVNLSQTTLTNWSAGGDNSFAVNAFLNGALQYNKEKWSWLNTLALEYGVTTNETQGMQKTADRIDFATQLGYAINKKWSYSALADFKTQFYKGYNYPNKENYISNFMAPAYSTVSVGIEYKPNDFFSAYYSPLAVKMTFVNDDYLSNEGLFGVDPGDKFKAEFGTYLKAQIQKDLMENVKLISDATFFTAYNESFGNVDVEWNMLINMKINKYLSANLNTTLKYDDDTKYINEEGIKSGARVQFKEMLGVGVSYNF